ncbi:hypothetical protein JD969_10510 [Planctomycetota bacterium]|nr:hypothetical protein JD969_10510 [Planctomycetota bacterium]
MNIYKSIFSCALTFIAITATAHAAPLVILHSNAADHPNVAVAIQGIEVDGITYTANFHPQSTSFTNKFINIWDPNNDNDFSDGITGTAPAFFYNESHAISAYNQIQSALGDFLMTHDEQVTDGFVIPTAHPIDDTSVFLLLDQAALDLNLDNMMQLGGSRTTSAHTSHVWTTFTAVPEPTSLALLSLTTLPLLTHRKRKA